MSMTIGDRIRMKREQMGMSQDELAKKVGYRNRSTIATIEGGRNCPRQSSLRAFAAALDTTVGYLMGLDENPEAAGAQDFELLDKWHRLKEADRAAVMTMIDALLR